MQAMNKNSNNECSPRICRQVTRILSLFALVFLANSAHAQTCYDWTSTWGTGYGPYTTPANACSNNYSYPGDYTYTDGEFTTTNNLLVNYLQSGSLAAGNALYVCKLIAVTTAPPQYCAEEPQTCGTNVIADQIQTLQTAVTPPPLNCGYYVQATKQALNEICTANCPADPVNPGNGNVYERERDGFFAGITGSIAFDRFYSSSDFTGADMGPGWRHSYGRSIVPNIQLAVPASYPGKGAASAIFATPAEACTSGFLQIQSQVIGWQGANITATYTSNTCVISSATGVISTLPIYSPYLEISSTVIEYDVIRDDGQTLRYTTQNGNGTIINPPGISLQLAQTANGFTLTDDQDNVEAYNTSGVLQSITSRAGVVQTISYDANGFFSGVTDSFGRSLSVTRNAAEQITSVTFNGGGTVQYAYDNLLRLNMVTNLDGTTRSYVYGDSRFTNALTALYDENQTELSTWAYDAEERCTSTQQIGGVGAINLQYDPNETIGTVQTTDALGAVRTFSYTRIGDL